MNWMESARRIQEDLEGLSAFTATPGQGCTRLPFTPETRGAADFLLKKMEEAGLETWQDPAGNLFGLLPGRNREKPCILCGSHYDSVPGGGNYDGIAGVVCAIELARVLREKGSPPRRTIWPPPLWMRRAVVLAADILVPRLCWAG